MILIREIVQQALNTGCLTIEAEEQLRQLLNTKYDREDFNAFMTLQEAAMTGQVKQESRERLSKLCGSRQSYHRRSLEFSCLPPLR